MLPGMEPPTGILTALLDGLWRMLRSDHPELPPARVALSSSPVSRNHDAGRWSLDSDGVLIGLRVGPDTLSDGAEATVTAILHEAAHVLCWARGVKDTSSAGAYHNKIFTAAAVEIGLRRPDTPGTSRGEPDPVLTPASAERFASIARSLEPAIEGTMPYLARTEPARQHRDRITLTCRCDPVRHIRVYATVHAQGPILCGICGQEFAAQE